MDLTVSVGEMRVGNDTDKAATCSIPLLPTVALLLGRLGVEGDAAKDLITEVMQEALTLGKDATEELLKESGVKAAQDALKKDVIAKLPRTPVKGTVKLKDVEIDIKGMAVQSDEN